MPKKSENGVLKNRLCVDFRALNVVTNYDSYPLPRFEETTSTLSGSKYFSVLDCYSGFWQNNIHEPHREKTAFSVRSLGHYQFNRLKYGLSNSPANFKRLMDLVLKSLTETECWVFIDNVIVYSDTVEEHAKKLSEVFERFRRANLQLQPEKCVFAKDKGTYLGFEWSYRGIEASPDKVKAVQNFPTPLSVKYVRSYLCLVSQMQEGIERPISFASRQFNKE